VEDPAEAVTSVDVQLGEPVGVGDRFGQRGEWPVRVVEDLVLAQRVQQMPLVPDQPSCPGGRGQPCSVSRFEPDPLPVELALQDGELVT
jgi:hypothetical protein